MFTRLANLDVELRCAATRAFVAKEELKDKLFYSNKKLKTDESEGKKAEDPEGKKSEEESVNTKFFQKVNSENSNKGEEESTGTKFFFNKDSKSESCDLSLTEKYFGKDRPKAYVAVDPDEKVQDDESDDEDEEDEEVKSSSSTKENKFEEIAKLIEEAIALEGGDEVDKVTVAQGLDEIINVLKANIQQAKEAKTSQPVQTPVITSTPVVPVVTENGEKVVTGMNFSALQQGVSYDVNPYLKVVGTDPKTGKPLYEVTPEVLEAALAKEKERLAKEAAEKNK